MGNLIQNIPVYKPQTQPVQKPAVQTPSQAAVKSAPKTSTFANSPFANAPVYTYAPARPLSPANTIPQGVKPQAAAGHLVKENIFQSMGSTVKSYGDYVKYFYNAAFKGEGSDYSVGKINDLAIRAGSLGIATVLATSKVFPFAKGMEFVGLGTWFASMAIWPKILGAPIQMKTGVDINQRYIDSYGRRKFVYEDNQYRPMDIYRHADLNGKPLTPEEYYAKYDHDYVYLEKKGDRLGIPRDIKNRNEATMNKMGQVAVQGKTLWMLTAGVMTPVVSSLAADALQGPLKNQLEKHRYNKQLNTLHELDKKVDDVIKSKNTNIDNVMTKLDVKLSPEIEKQMNSVITENGQYSTKDYEKLSAFLNDRFNGTGFKEAIDDSLKSNALMSEPHVKLTSDFRMEINQVAEQTVKEFMNSYKDKKKVISSLPVKFTEYTGLPPKRIVEIAGESFNDLDAEMNTDALSAFKRKFIFEVKQDLGKLKSTDSKTYKSVIKNIEKKLETNLESYVETKKHYILPKDKITKLIKFAETNLQIRQRIQKFEETSIKNISESMTANNWAKIPVKYLKSLGFTKGELALIATQDSPKASKVITKKLEQIAKDPEKYQKAVETMTEYAKTAISKEEKAVIELIGSVNKKGTLIKVQELMINVAEKEFNGSMKDAVAQNYNAIISNVQRKFRNTVDSLVRPIKAMEIVKDIKNVVKRILGRDKYAYDSMINESKHSWQQSFYTFHNMSYSTACESMEQFLKDAVLQKNDLNNWTTKWEYDIPNSRRGFKHSMEMVRRISLEMFGDMNKNTASIMKDADFVERCNINNSVMRARFIRIENELAETINKKGDTWNYMQDKNVFYSMVDDYIKGNKGLYKKLAAMLEDRRSDIPASDFENCRNILNAVKDGTFFKEGYKQAPARQCLIDKLDFYSSNKSMAEMSGKNITEFFIQAAQDIRSRAKWTKLVYGLLIGTGVVSAVTIALMGKKNYFNKDIYEPLDSSQGAGN